MLGYKFRRQYGVDAFKIDFYCPELQLAVEVDGEIHNTPEAREYDKQRQQYIETFGIKFLRLTNAEIEQDIDNALKKIATMIRMLEHKKTNRVENPCG